MDFNIDMRLKQLQSLDNFILHSRDKVQSILDCLKWNVKDTLKESSLIKCSIDPNHRVSANSVEAHIQKCLLKKEGYGVNDEFLSEPVGDTISSVRIIDPVKVEVLSAARQKFPGFKPGWNGEDVDPQTGDRLLTTFSPDERLAFYEYAVANTTGPSELPEFNILQPRNNHGVTLTEEELLRKERDAKRRRIKYKSVHTNRKSYTEIMRDVINGQMELYSEWINGNDTEEKLGGNEDSMANLGNTEKYSSYAESVSKHSTYSASSSVTKHNGDSHPNTHTRDSHESKSLDYRNDNSASYNHRARLYDNRRYERSYKSGSGRRHRSRSGGRRESRKRHRSRSRSNDRYYSRNRH